MARHEHFNVQQVLHLKVFVHSTQTSFLNWVMGPRREQSEEFIPSHALFTTPKVPSRSQPPSIFELPLVLSGRGTAAAYCTPGTFLNGMGVICSRECFISTSVLFGNIVSCLWFFSFHCLFAENAVPNRPFEPPFYSGQQYSAFFPFSDRFRVKVQLLRKNLLENGSAEDFHLVRHHGSNVIVVCYL